jgi:hypothetical protein
LKTAQVVVAIGVAQMSPLFFNDSDPLELVFNDSDPLENG